MRDGHILDCWGVPGFSSDFHENSLLERESDFPLFVEAHVMKV